jgi:hypothetical protein
MVQVVRWTGLAIIVQLWLGAFATAASAEDAAIRHWETNQCGTLDAEHMYVCDVGSARQLSMRSFREVLATDEAVRSVVQRIGFPDRAELQQVLVAAPWLAWELRTYYRDYGRVYVFARAFALDEPQISVLRYQGPIPEGKLIEMTPARSDLIDRAERDAERAERAAAEAEAKADLAERNAARASAISSQAGDQFKASLIKH